MMRGNGTPTLNGARQHRPLYGIPFVAKDNIDTSALPTSAGSAALANSIPIANAVVVQKLLDAGAILLGKANLSELAESDGWLGYSSAGGLTLNPFNTSRNASGSSSGSAAAVAADFAPFALGTDTSGSLRGPASVCGLVALRPTFGLIGRTGIVPASLTFDTTGALTRTVSRSSHRAQRDSGTGSRRCSDSHGNRRRRSAYPDGVKQGTLAGTRLGIVTNFRGGSVEVDRIEGEVLERLRGSGVELIQIRLPLVFETLWPDVLSVVGEAEFKPEFERYLATRPPGAPTTLTELIARSAERSEHGRPINPARLETLRRANVTRLIDSAVYIDLLTRQIPQLRQALETILDQNHVRALVFATMSCPASPRFDQPDPHLSLQCARSLSGNLRGLSDWIPGDYRSRRARCRGSPRRHLSAGSAIRRERTHRVGRASTSDGAAPATAAIIGTENQRTNPVINRGPLGRNGTKKGC